MLQMSLMGSRINSTNNLPSSFFYSSSANLAASNNNNLNSPVNPFKGLTCDLARLKYLAGNDDVHAQAQLGWHYIYGIGVVKNSVEAEKWLSLAVKKLETLPELWAQGLCYQWGIGIHKNLDLAIKYYQVAAEQNYALAQNSLGLCYEQGIGVVKDENEAVKLQQKAADQGYAVAQYMLGECYEGGHGVAEDEKQAVHWYQKAADQGYADAKAKIALEKLMQKNRPAVRY